MKKQCSTVTSKGWVTVPINELVTSLKGILPPPSTSLTLEEMNEVINGMYDRHL
jgi:hypothetical protein